MPFLGVNIAKEPCSSKSKSKLPNDEMGKQESLSLTWTSPVRVLEKGLKLEGRGLIFRQLAHSLSYFPLCGLWTICRANTLNLLLITENYEKKQT
jgi:hypothetical protein